VFGCLKATSRNIYLRETQGHLKENLKKKDAVAILIRSWEKLSFSAMESAWKIYRPDEEEETVERTRREEEEDISEDVIPDDIFLGPE
jgi:hypothetical protein